MTSETLPATRSTELDVVEAFKTHAVTARQIQAIAIKNTLQTDWINYGGNAWLDAPGAERIARALGLTVKDWTHTRENMEDDQGPYYIITCTGKIGHAPSDMWTECLGVQWSRKPFFYKDGDKHRHIGEIHPGNIIKDAFSDMTRNGVTRLLGLRGLPWEFLKELGIDQARAKHVDFEKGARGESGSSGRKGSHASDFASAQQISVLCRTAAKKVIDQTQETIRETLPKELKRTHMNELLKWLPALPGEIDYDEWKRKVADVCV